MIISIQKYKKLINDYLTKDYIKTTIIYKGIDYLNELHPKIYTEFVKYMDWVAPSSRIDIFDRIIFGAEKNKGQNCYIIRVGGNSISYEFRDNVSLENSLNILIYLIEDRQFKVKEVSKYHYLISRM